MTDPIGALVGPIRDRHERVLETIAAAARAGGRSPEGVRLVVVTKARPLEVAQAVIEAGARILGENYAEEGVAKIQALRGSPAGMAEPGSAATPADVEWHMIGHVQGRKARMVALHFDLMHSLDSPRLAERFDRLGTESGRRIAVLLEFNVGGETTKGGWAAEDERRWPELLKEVEEVVNRPSLNVRGLMTMPPLARDPEATRPYFRQLRRLQEFLRARIPTADWAELSMGTSADYVVAVEEGATLVRVGEAILGPRPVRETT